MLQRHPLPRYGGHVEQPHQPPTAVLGLYAGTHGCHPVVTTSRDISRTAVTDHDGGGTCVVKTIYYAMHSK